MNKGLTFGAFEYIHIGHINLIYRASQMCDYLIVGLSTDEYIEKKKGHKPEFNWGFRKQMLEQIKGVELVIPQSESFGKKEAIEHCNPNFLFVGNDWTPETYTGEGLGVPVIYLERTLNISSTQIRNARETTN